MGLIDENDLKDYEKFNSNYEKYNNKQARFNTKIASETRHNGEVVDVLGFIKGKDIYDDRYIVRFNDGTINNNIMTNELEFDFIRDPVQEDMRRELSKIIKSYELNDKEVEELQMTVINYDYEANEGTVFTRVESVERLFTDEDSKEIINPSIKQLKAMAEYIRYTEKYYMLYGYQEYTEKVIDLILSKDENGISKIDLLNEMKDMINHNIMCYSSNYSLGKAKQGFEKDYERENKKLILIEQMIKDEKQKVKRKNKEAR